MLKKLYIGFCLFTLVQQEYFAMEKPFKINPQHTKNSPIRIYIQGTKNSPIFESDENENHFIDWETINIWVNGRKKVVPKLWLL